MVSGDVAFRIMHILAFIGAVPASNICLLLTSNDLRKMVANVEETYVSGALVAVAGILVFTVVFLAIRYPVPREAALGLRVGILSSILASIIFWGWLTYTYGYTFPLYVLSELYTIATLAFVDFFLAIMTILVALITTIERM